MFRLQEDQSFLPSLFKGQGRYSSPTNVLDDVRWLSCFTRFRSGRRPKAPFVLVRLEDFNVHLPDEQPPIPEDMEERVDDILSCKLCYDCIAPRATGSVLWQGHLSTLENLHRSGTLPAACKPQFADEEFRLPTSLVTQQHVSEYLHPLKHHDRAHVWVTDAEGLGCTSTGLTTIPTEFALMNCEETPREYHAQFRYLGYPTTTA
ncbi:Nn.00g102870.m01.CDS01 [Neocucurbitaria sp. VM-36]